jgi:thiamine biosynthesis protein ThiS
MIVTLNGERHTVAAGTTIAALVAELGLGERRVAVEVNCDVIPRDRYVEQTLRAGDVVEIVQFVGGG